MGGKLRVEKGFIKVNAGDHYTELKGFGWLASPVGTFDSLNTKLPQQLLKDAVYGSGRIVFRADIPDGDYFLTLTLGLPPVDTAKMLVQVNGIQLPDTIITPWYRLSYKTLRKKISIKDQRAEIAITSVSGSPIGVYGIEFRPVTNWRKIDFQTSLEEDSATVHRFAVELHRQLKNDTGNTALANQLEMVSKYLLACYYFDGGGWSQVVKKTGLSLIYRMYAAADLLEQIIADPSDPLYDRSLYLLAKIYYWLDQEDDNLYHTNKFNRYFSLLKNKFPGDTLIRMYLGEKFFEKPAFDTAAGTAPLWAIYQREAMKRMERLIHWWVNIRQTPNGEMGGKYGDDVELLRWWLPAILGSDDSIAKKGYMRLADGVWSSDALEDGFAKRVDDVEHSAELFRDTHPAMFLIKYGDPEYVERCLISMQHFRDVWSGRTSRGHLHFKSYYLSATQALSQPPHAMDVALNARALLPGLWAAWYSRNPTLIRLFSAWGNAWVADAQRTDKGKPPGILPSAISFPDDQIAGDSKEWYDAHLSYDYYRWDHIGHVNELQNHLLGMYDITRKGNFLKPLKSYAALMETAGRDDTLKMGTPGSLAWVKYLLIGGGLDKEQHVNPMGKLFAMAQRITNSSAFDSLVADYGEPYNKYRVVKDKNVIIRGLANILKKLRYNYPLLTTEVKFTDRVYMPGSDLLTGMYTGHFGAGYEYPSLTATWKNTGSDVAVFVRNGDHQSADISLFNFGSERTVTMKTWQLDPGWYTITEGIDSNDDDSIDVLLSEKKIQMAERVNSVDIKLPAKKSLVVEIRRIKSFDILPHDNIDIALAPDDILLPDTVRAAATAIEVQTIIHNIGNLAAKNVTVELWVDDKKVDTEIIPGLEAPNDLRPRTKRVSLKWVAAPGRHLVAVKAVTRQREITRTNNYAIKRVTIE